MRSPVQPIHKRTAFIIALCLLVMTVFSGCLDDESSVKERLLSEESAAQIGLYHCTMGETFQAQGFSSNPARMSEDDFGEGNETPFPEEAWMQILGPHEDVECEMVAGNQSVFVTAMRFDSAGTVADFVDEEDPCGEFEGEVFIEGAHVVSMDGAEEFIDEVARVVAEENPDLSPLC